MGKIIGKSNVTQSISSGETLPITQLFHADHPYLWNGVKEPATYKLKVALLVGGKVQDQVIETFGFRQFAVDPERGLLLNGEPYDLHGVDIHQGRVSCGWAATRAMQDEDYRLVRELGCTGVRMAHYPHADHEYELCDQRGLVVWAEIPLVNRATDSQGFFDNTKQQLRELIRQEGNHPSILFWSLYNEPAVRKNGDQEWRLVRELNQLAHQLDPTRLTTGAVSIGAASWLDWVMDLTAFNRYWGWYSKGVDQWPHNLVNLREEAAGRSFGVSEFGAGANVNQHEDRPSAPSPGGKWHPEEWQAEAHEQIWPALRDQPWIWCKFIWVMFDFSSVGRNEGDQPGVNDKGLVTSDRKTKKDAFFFYKANWNPEPMVYIADRRYNPRQAGPTTFKVYSNCESVELFLNGRSLGRIKGENHVFKWDADVPKGTVRVEAIGTGEARKPRDRVAWDVQRSPLANSP
jgi:beta-galactosidase